MDALLEYTNSIIYQLINYDITIYHWIIIIAIYLIKVFIAAKIISKIMQWIRNSSFIKHIKIKKLK